MTKNIVLITRSFSPQNTGFANAAAAFYEVLRSMPGVHVSVITLAKCSSDHPDDPKIFRAKTENYFLSKLFGIAISFVSKARICPSCAVVLSAWTNDWLMYQMFKKICIVNKPDQIIFETNVFPFLGPRLIKEYGDKVSFRLHSTEDTELLYYSRSFNYKSLLVKNRVFGFCRDVSNVYSTNAYHLEFFKEKILGNNPLIIYDKSYYVIPNAVKESINSNISLRFEEIISRKFVLFLGKLSKEGWMQKGLGDIISALAYVACKPTEFPSGIPENFILVVIGKGAMESHFIDKVNNYNLSKHIVHIRETQSDETNLLIKHSSFVMVPSRFEGQSMFLTEVLCAGKPIITTSGTGSSDLVSNNNGYLVEIGNVRQLASACFGLWNQNQANIDTMGRNSRVLYERSYSYKAVAEKVKELLFDF